jgi:taspase (threonine aspartase 1)
MGWCVAAHAGCGYHAERQEPQYRATLRRANDAAAAILANDGSALSAVAAAIAALEDDEITNAGLGSNLTEDGRVECDASVMVGSGPKAFPGALPGASTWAAVAAAPGLRNPVRAAAHLLQRANSPEGPSLGRVAPIALAGDAAWRWCAREGLAVADVEVPLPAEFQVSAEVPRTQLPASRCDSARLHQHAQLRPQPCGAAC